MASELKIVGNNDPAVMTVVGLPRLSDDELETLSRLNPGWAFERDDEGRTIMSPTSSKGSAKSAEALAQLAFWRKDSGAGGKIFDCDAGFKLSTGAVRAPDASWLSQARIDALGPRTDETYWPLCPDVTIEVRSPSNTWDYVVAKVKQYVREGSRYAVAIDPLKRRVFEIGTPPEGLALDFDAIMDA